MLYRYRARSLDDIYLEDIPWIVHPHTAQCRLAHTAQPNRRVQTWDLPEGYRQFADRYRCFHFQCPWAAYRDALGDVKSGNVVLLKPTVAGYGVTEVLTSSGSPLDNLPLFLYARLREIIARQLKRPVYYIRRTAPAPHTETTKTINSKMAGRLLAAGGVYNGNADDFSKTAQQLGGEAPAGYAQVMENKGLLIAGASVAGGLTMGRVRFPELEALEHSGARGATSGRPFDPEKAGGPIEHLTTDGVNITHEGIAIVEKHVARFDYDPGNEFMVNRLKKIADGEIPPEQVDLNYYTHECREYQRYCNSGWETGRPADNVEAYDLWNNTHTATLEDYRLKGTVDELYHKDAPTW